MEIIQKIKTYLRKLLEINPNDMEKIVNLSVLNFLVVASSSMGLSIATSLFLKTYGIAHLPKMYLVNAGVIVFVTFALFASSYFRRIAILTNTSLALGIIVILLRVLIVFDVKLIYPVLYVLSAMIFWLFYTQFWTLAVELCNIREGKRIFSYVVSAGLLGGGTAGLLIKSSISILHTENLLFLWAILFFIIAIFSRAKAESLKMIPLKNRTDYREEENGILSQMGDTLSYFSKTSLVRMLAINFILYGLVIYLLDYQFNKIMNASFKELDGLTGFYGVYSIAFYATTFFIQLFIASHVLKNIGTANTIIIFPATLGVSFALLAAKFNYLSGLFARFNRDVIGYSLIDSAYPLLFSPLKEGYRNKALALIEGAVIPLGTALAGLLLLIFVRFTDLQISLISLGLALLWLYFTFLLKKSYRSIFVQNLAERSLPEVYPLVGQLTELSEKRSITILRNSLRDKNDKVSLFAIQALGRHKDAQDINYLIAYLGENPSHIRRATIIKVLGETKDQSYINVLSKYLEDSDPRVRANTIESLGIIGGNNVRELVRPYLNDTEMRVKINAATVLWKYGDTTKGIEVLSKSIKDVDPFARIRSVYALAQIATDDCLPPLLEASKDSHNKVRLEAAFGLGRIDKKEAVIRLLQMLSDSDRRAQQAAFKALAQKKGIKDLLILELSSADFYVREKIIAILAARQEGKSVVFKYLKERVKNIYGKIMWYNAFINEERTLGLNLFLETLRNTNKRDIEEVLKISSVIEGSTVFGLIIKRLKDKDTRLHAEVLELMESLHFESMAFLKSVIPLLEDTPAEELAKIAKDKYNLVVKNPKQVYKEILSKEHGEWLKGCVLYIIGERCEKDFAPYLLKNIENTSAFLREVSLESLSKIDQGQARQAAQKLVYDEGLYVRSLARKLIESAAPA